MPRLGHLRRLINQAEQRRAALAAGYSRYGQPGWLTIEELTLALPGLAPAATPLTIGHLSDLHIGIAIAPARAREAVALVNSQQPDIIVLTGDFVTLGPFYLRAAAQAVADLQAPLGVYAVLGNHDYWCGANRLTRLLQAQGIQVLRNQHRRIELAGGPLFLIGLDDVLCGRADLDAALEGVPANAARILLVHEPDFADTAAEYGIPLQLSGHTHGGQIRRRGRPLVLPKLGRRYPRGLHQVPGSSTYVYTSRGIGTAGPPLRYDSPPEIALIRLLAPQPTVEPTR